MKNRNYSLSEYWKHIAESHTPSLSFTGSTKNDYMEWQEKARQKLVDLIGASPEKVPLNPETLSINSKNQIITEHIVIDSEKHMSIPCFVLRPENMKPDSSSAAILCVHGHGPFGKEAVAGIRTTSEHIENINKHNYDYGLQMAHAGFLTLIPDLRGFGERFDPLSVVSNKDACDINNNKALLLGQSLLSAHVHDMRCCIDYLETRSEIDPKRIGMMGLSTGGTVTLFTASLDKRIKAANISGYLNSFGAFGLTYHKFCGTQIIHNLFSWLDTHDIAGLIAPRALLVEMGKHDTVFKINDLQKGFEKAKNIYQAAGYRDLIEADIHKGGHAFAGNRAFDFFKTSI